VMQDHHDGRLSNIINEKARASTPSLRCDGISLRPSPCEKLFSL
jgi:hypothetical protein